MKTQLTLLTLLTYFTVLASHAATITGTLRDISVQALDTKIMFAPTNQVLVTGSGLSAGPPKVVDSVNGQFSIVLEAGDYSVSLPLIPWRQPFAISVMDADRRDGGHFDRPGRFARDERLAHRRQV